jgi:hypothetical protein
MEMIKVVIMNQVVMMIMIKEVRTFRDDFKLTMLSLTIATTEHALREYNSYPEISCLSNEKLMTYKNFLTKNLGVHLRNRNRIFEARQQ